MAQGSKASYSAKQKRMASHIESSAKRRGRGTKTAERIAWATVNKRTGGARGSSTSRSKRSSRSRSGSARKAGASRTRAARGRSGRSRAR